ncbi:hypothetical protein ACIP5Y_10115 [Nocardia sp. NPDC088792]|uniref:hypothetical protein n=1 Tax=Nocardia sp. NPDC088792 TaxID=3364332 RepID=UPI0037FD2609
MSAATRQQLDRPVVAVGVALGTSIAPLNPKMRAGHNVPGPHHFKDWSDHGDDHAEDHAESGDGQTGSTSNDGQQHGVSSWLCVQCIRITNGDSSFARSIEPVAGQGTAFSTIEHRMPVCTPDLLGERMCSKSNIFVTRSTEGASSADRGTSRSRSSTQIQSARYGLVRLSAENSSGRKFYRQPTGWVSD